MAGPITAYTLAEVTGPSAIGPDRSRLRSLGIYATAPSTFTLTNGDGGDTLLTGAFPTGYHEVYIPDDGILATAGVYVSEFTAADGIMTIMLN